MRHNVFIVNMTLRKSIFWIHLACGVVTGLVIAMMSVTGIAIAFEEEILDWYDRDVSRVEIPDGAETMSVEELHQIVLTKRPDFPASFVEIPKDYDLAYKFFVGRQGPIYANQYTGELKETRAEGPHDFIHTLEMWHRFVGIDGDSYVVGRMITGICNFAFVVLCVTGLYLWCPRKWSKRLFRQIAWFKSTRGKKARDFNWHNVFGFWSMPVLLVLAGTAVVISFNWAHELPFKLLGEEPPKVRDFRMMAVKPATVPESSWGKPLLSIGDVIRPTQERYPDWESIGLTFPAPLVEGEPPPIKLDLTRPDYMPSRAWTPVEIDPFTGEILQAIHFTDRSPGLQARVWIRFIHTGAGFGIPGKIIASIFTAFSLVLVYTGFSLSYRRFLGKKREV